MTSPVFVQILTLLNNIQEGCCMCDQCTDHRVHAGHILNSIQASLIDAEESTNQEDLWLHLIR